MISIYLHGILAGLILTILIAWHGGVLTRAYNRFPQGRNKEAYTLAWIIGSSLFSVLFSWIWVCSLIMIFISYELTK